MTWLCTFWTCMTNLITWCVILVPVWRAPWHNMASWNQAWGTVGVPNDKNYITPLPELRFGQSKACMTWLCTFWTCMTNLITWCVILVPVWRAPWHNMASWNQAWGTVGVPNDKNYITPLPELRFGQSEGCNTWPYNLWTRMFNIGT